MYGQGFGGYSQPQGFGGFGGQQGGFGGYGQQQGGFGGYGQQQGYAPQGFGGFGGYGQQQGFGGFGGQQGYAPQGFGGFGGGYGGFMPQQGFGGYGGGFNPQQGYMQQQPQKPSYMDNPEYQGYQTQMQDLTKQMDDYVQNAPMQKQLQELQAKMQGFRQQAPQWSQDGSAQTQQQNSLQAQLAQQAAMQVQGGPNAQPDRSFGGYGRRFNSGQFGRSDMGMGGFGGIGALLGQRFGYQQPTGDPMAVAYRKGGKV